MNRDAFFRAAFLRTAFFRAGVITAALGLFAGCGESMDDDAGVDSGSTMTDSGPIDSGPGAPDTGTPDAGPVGCQTDCEFVELTAGVVHMCGRRANGEVLCWGRAQESQLGDGRSRHDNCAAPGSPLEDCSGLPVNVRYDDGVGAPIIMDAEAITARGFSASCALRSGELWCWSNQTVPDVAGGIPTERQIAERDVDSIADITQASVSGGHLCVVEGASDRVQCVGGGSSGQLGRGVFVEQVVDPAPVLLDATSGAEVELTGAIEVVVSHGSFTCARTADSLYCWGRNASGQLGDNLTHTECVVSTTDRFDCSANPVLVGDPSAPLGALSALSLGSSHACAIVSAVGSPGQVVCWGDNRGGQSGQPDSMQNVAYPTDVAGVDDAIAIAAGSSFTCALRTGGAISCWGRNFDGQLGDGVMNHGTTCMSGSSLEDCSRTPVDVAVIDDGTALAANGSSVCAIRANGSVWCWGNNNQRQLGDGTRNNRSMPAMVQGTAP